MHTITSVLHEIPIPLNEARLLVGHVLALTATQLITQSQQTVDAHQLDQIKLLVNRRLQGEPIAYLLGRKEFYGLMFVVTPDVLIPRPETELLVEQACLLVPAKGRILELGTGSGAIAVSLLHERPDLSITATDISLAALQCAQHNAKRLLTHQQSSQIDWLQSDWFDGLKNQVFDLILSNPPYIAAHDPHLKEGDLRFEPIHALTDHHNGLSALTHIIQHAPRTLQPKGHLLLEHGYNQAKSVQKLMKMHGFKQIQGWKDLAGIIRVSCGQIHL